MRLSLTKYARARLAGAVLLSPLLIAGCGGGGGGDDAPPVAQNPPGSNQPPAIASVSPQSVDENAVLGPIELGVADAETSVDALSVQARSADGSLLPADGVDIVGSGANRSLFLIPAEGQSGATNVTVDVADASGSRSSMTFAVDVHPLFPGEFSGWMRGVVMTRDSFDTSVGELNEDGTPLAGVEDIPRIAFSDDSADDPTAYDDLLVEDSLEIE